MELEEAIERLKRGIEDTMFSTLYSQEQEEEDVKAVLNHLTKQEKMIDLMIDDLETEYSHYEPCLIDEFVDCEKYENCEECIKQYFEKKAEE